MDGRRLTALAIVLCLALVGLSAAGAQAAPVLVMGHSGRVRAEQNRFLSAADTVAPALRPTPSSPRPTPGSPRRAIAAVKRVKPVKPKASVTVPGVLAALLSSGQITAAEHTTYLGDWNRALGEEKALSKARAAQLASVTEMLHTLAVGGDLTASRLPVLFLTLERNAQWWKRGPMLAYGARVQFAGSELEWEYYTGEGIQLQVLGTFGEADGFYEAGAATYPKLLEVVNEMIPLAVERGGGLAWEYYFNWQGGAPPWVSAMAQATGLEALTNAYLASHDATYLSTAHEALGILQTPPPTGVAVPTALGTEFLQYNFEPRTDIINAFLQTLVGLDDYAKVSSDPTATALFNAGDADAQAVLPSFNTGAWSDYQPGEADDLNYHELVTTFLTNLCTLTATAVYCDTAKDFSTDLTTPPVIVQKTMKAVRKRTSRLYFTLDKPAHIGVIVANPRGRDVLHTSADCQPGTDYWIVPKLAAGHYTVRLSGTDLAGNYATTSGTLTVA